MEVGGIMFHDAEVVGDHIGETAESWDEVKHFDGDMIQTCWNAQDSLQERQPGRRSIHV